MNTFRTITVLAALTFSTLAGAQVHRCTDAAGKTTFSDAPCPTSAKSAAQVLGSDATDRRWENEAYGAERNMQSIENASRILREPTSDAQLNGQGPVLMDHDPNLRIREQDQRNTQRRLAELRAEQARRADLEERRRAAQAVAAPPFEDRRVREINNCAGSYCYDTKGGSYLKNNGQLLSNDGKSCRQRIGGLPGQLECY